MKKSVVHIIITVALVSAVGMALPTRSLAACDTEEVIFGRADSTDADGARGTFDLKNRDLDSTCTAEAEAHSTAHMRNTSLDRGAEIGYVERWGPNSSHTFRVFWETYVGETFTNGSGFNAGRAVACCSMTEFKVISIADTDKWTFFFDYGNSGTFTQLGPTDGAPAGFTHGIPMGETGRRGGTGTGAGDEHKNLEKKNCGSCAWINWRTNYQHADTISNWHYHYLDPNHYEVVKDA
jgi:hypothetical protein